MNKPFKLSLSVGEFFSTEVNNATNNIDKVDKEQFLYGYTKCFADGLTKHKYYFPLDVIKKAAHTIRGKPLLAAFNIWHSDGLGGHDTDEVGVGYVPDNAEIKYEKSDDGRTFLCTNFALWKYYSNDLPKILKDSNNHKKDVSVELFILDSEKDAENNYTIVKEFVFCGITILSQDIMPAVENAQMEITKFSQKAQSVFENLKNYVNNESEKSDSFLLQKNSKEKKMAEKNKIENSVQSENAKGEPLDNAWKSTNTTVDISKRESTYHDDGTVTREYEDHTKSVTVEKEVPESTALQNSDETSTVVNSQEDNVDDSEKLENSWSEKYSVLESDYQKLKNSYETLVQKYSVLEEFKRNKDNEEKKQAVECALNDVVDVLGADDISAWRKKSETFSNVDDFKNALKAFAFDVQHTKGIKPIETLRNSIPTKFDAESDPNNIWDSLSSYY